MKISEVESRISEIKVTLTSLYKTLYRDILNKIENVFYFYKEFAEYENSIYRWIKTYKDGQDVSLITIRLIQSYYTATNNNSDIVILKDNNTWNPTEISVPVTLVKLIMEEFEK